jgi:hypothetical protein
VLRQEAAGAELQERRRELRSCGSSCHRIRRCRGVGFDVGHHGADLDGVALGGQQLRDDAGGGTRHLGVDLVGRDVENRLVAVDRVTRLLVPLEDASFGDALAHLGHLYFDRHRSILG